MGFDQNIGMAQARGAGGVQKIRLPPFDVTNHQSWLIGANIEI